jgi:hypothetical protein
VRDHEPRREKILGRRTHDRSRRYATDRRYENGTPIRGLLDAAYAVDVVFGDGALGEAKSPILS